MSIRANAYASSHGYCLISMSSSACWHSKDFPSGLILRILCRDMLPGMAEVLRIKEVMQKAVTGKRCLVVLDEMFRGRYGIENPYD